MVTCFHHQHSLVGRALRASRRGFTLIELLVVVSIVGILAGLSTAGVFKALSVANSVKESNAAKSLLTAYLAAASDNNGYLIPGYDRSAAPVSLPAGGQVSGITAWRYPYRLAAYFDYDIKGTLMTSDNASRILLTDTYSVSAYPSFGINYLFVGGDVDTTGNINHLDDCLQVSARNRGASLLVFATAAGQAGVPGSSTENMQGYCKIEPPKVGGGWSTAKWTPKSQPGSYGQVDPRHGNKAICAFLDGSVRKLTIEELRDMRLWSYRAADADNPDYTLSN